MVTWGTSPIVREWAEGEALVETETESVKFWGEN